MTPDIVRAAQKALGRCEECETKVEFMRQIAKVCPKFSETAEQLTSKLEFMKELCKTSLGEGEDNGK